MAWGEYPAEYNPRVHGPYDPARYYGKRKVFAFNCVTLSVNFIRFHCGN